MSVFFTTLSQFVIFQRPVKTRVILNSHLSTSLALSMSMCAPWWLNTYRPSSTSLIFSGSRTLRVSGSRKTEIPLMIPALAKISGGRKPQTSSNIMTNGANELPIRQTNEVKPRPHCLSHKHSLMLMHYSQV